jgi:hypothetical protein
MNQYNFNAPWDPLRHVCVGAGYAPAFYEPIKNTFIRDSLQRIAEETESDYKNLIATLQQFDIAVDRPTVDADCTIMDYVDTQGQLNYSTAKSFTLIPRPPMQPRDCVLVIGNQLYGTNSEIHCYDIDAESTPWPFDAPLVTVIGQDLIVDCRDHPELPELIRKLQPDRNVIPVTIGGHNDAVFCPVRPGVIVSTYHHDNYRDSFPGWQVKYIENQSWNAIPNWRKTKHSNVGKWWVPDDIDNPEFADFVDTWLTNWVGYVQETVFDVNMLQINDRTVLVNNYNREMFEFFAQQHIEPIITPFRHRFFWDGGLHCITADLYREGDSDVYITR